MGSLRRILLGAVTSLVLFTPLEAGQLHPLPLKEVVARVQRIVVARVRSVQHQKSSVYQVTVLRDLLQHQPAGDAQFSYECHIENLEFDGPGPKGQTMHYSVMTEASGHEYEPKPGEDWLFLLYQKSGQTAVRIEPISSLPAIEAMVKER